jgi:hypothetical protein
MPKYVRTEYDRKLFSDMVQRQPTVPDEIAQARDRLVDAQVASASNPNCVVLGDPPVGYSELDRRRAKK